MLVDIVARRRISCCCWCCGRAHRERRDVKDEAVIADTDRLVVAEVRQRHGVRRTVSAEDLPCHTHTHTRTHTIGIPASRKNCS